MIKIPMLVHGVDLSDDALLEGLDADISHLDWVTHGPLTLAIHYSGQPSQLVAMLEAEECARLIHKLQPGAAVTAIYDELVGLHEIGVRCGVSPEAVRTWVRGLRRGQSSPFPLPRQVIFQGGARSLLLYAWRDVLQWARDVLDLDPDEDISYLDDVHTAELNAFLATERPLPLPNDYRPVQARLPEDGDSIAFVNAGVGLLPWEDVLALSRQPLFITHHSHTHAAGFDGKEWQPLAPTSLVSGK